MNAELLAHYPRPFKGEFLPVPKQIAIGHEFPLHGEPWLVVWCQRAGKVGWMALCVRKADLPD